MSVPISQFFLYRWYFRLFVWALLLWRVSRLDLQLLPTHPDQAGGLGFLAVVPSAFALVILAQGALLSGSIGTRILLQGATLDAFRYEIIAFVILAAFTYQSGLRAPALIAIVKDTLIFVTIFAAIVVIPAQLGGYSAIFSAVPQEKLTLTPPGEGTLGSYSAYATLALGSALALFLYPHAFTAILSSSSGNVIRRNAALLSAYSFILGLIALLGYMAIAAGVSDNPAYAGGFKLYGANFAVPALFLESFPSWFVGVAFAAIAIGALVPAAIMSIACANLYTRNLYKEFIRPDCTDAEEARMAKIVSLIVKIGAVVFILAIPLEYAINLQLLGGVWIIQLLPPILLGLYTRGLNARALLAGWAVGTAVGTYMAATQAFKPIFPLEIFGVTLPGYAALYSVLLNFLIAIALSPLFDLIARRSAASTTR